jgi:hypothetical protein
MKFIKIVNVLALLFIFTPFFQMCSDDIGGKRGVTENADSIAVGTDSLAEIALADSIHEDTLSQDINVDTMASKLPAQEVVDQPDMLSKFWQLITAPGGNSTITGFGMLVRTIFQLVEWTFYTWIGEILISFSILLSIYSLFRLIKNKAKRLPGILILNFLILITTFGLAFITFEEFSQIKWGFYSYLFLILVMLIQSFRLKKHAVS